MPLPGPAVVQGYYQRRAPAQRLDLIANYFLNDATASWKLCDANNAVVPDALVGARPDRHPSDGAMNRWPALINSS